MNPDDAQLIRVTIDVIVMTPMSDRKQEILAKAISNAAHTVIAEDEDEVNMLVEKFAAAHVHDTEDGDRCGYCVEQSRDYRSGRTVVAQAS